MFKFLDNNERSGLFYFWDSSICTNKTSGDLKCCHHKKKINTIKMMPKCRAPSNKLFLFNSTSWNQLWRNVQMKTMLNAQNAMPLPHSCHTAATSSHCCRVNSWDPHGVPKGPLIKIVVHVYVICKNSENAINLSKKITARQWRGSGWAAARHSVHAAWNSW
jgi:hypothetical protein